MIPKKVSVVEVGSRDGFQNVKDFIATEDKIRIIRAMIKAGVKTMEITSFVNPKWLPQMLDAAQVVGAILAAAPADFRAIALAPNYKGVELAKKAGIKDVTYVVSASETHNSKNVNRRIEESLAELSKIRQTFADLELRVSLATVFGCPFEGRVPLEQVLAMVDRITALGIEEIVLCDTIGVANPLQVKQMVQKVMDAYPGIRLGLHFHDTRGMGIANIFAGLTEGAAIFETSIGGLGGCPFAPGSAGNTATEDMLYLLSEMGIEHGIDMAGYRAAIDIVKSSVNAPLTGRNANIAKNNEEIEKS